MANPGGAGGSPAGAQTARRALDLLQTVVRQQDPISLTDLATASGLSTSTAYRLMRTLESYGFVARVPGGRSYVVGDELVAMSARVLHGIDLLQIAHPLMEELVGITGETASLHLRTDWRRTCVDTIEGVHPIRRVIEVGETLPLYAGSTGKSILAFLDEREQERVLARASDDGVDVEVVRNQLAETRRRGYMMAIGDRTPNVGGFAAPIFGAEGVRAALTISGPGDRWNKEAMRAAAPEIVVRAREISRRLGDGGKKSQTVPVLPGEELAQWKPGQVGSIPSSSQNSQQN